MELTSVKVFPVDHKTIKGNVSLCFDDTLVIRCTLMQSKKGNMFLTMPNHSYNDGNDVIYVDDVFFLDADTRNSVTDDVVDAYHETLEDKPKEEKPKKTTRKRSHSFK